MAARSDEFTLARSRRLACIVGRRRSTNRCLSRITSSTSTRSSTGKGGGSAAFSKVTVQSWSSTSPVGRSGLVVPAGRRRTSPSTATTYSLRTSTVPGTTHWTMPVWSRRSMKARCSPCSRRLATHPHTVARVPTSSLRRVPQRWVRIEVAPTGVEGSGRMVTAGPFVGSRSQGRGIGRGIPDGGTHSVDHLGYRHSALVPGAAQGPE